MSSNKLLYGFDEPLPKQTSLKAGPFSLIYENGFIRHIKYGSEEILRMIYMAVRDKNWGTYQAVIKEEQIRVGADSFEVHYTCLCNDEHSSILSWKVSITGDATGKIVFDISGEALETFWKNRAGCCILHPLKNTKGEPVIITHPNGKTSTGSFPVLIAPEDPFKQVSKLQWQASGRQYVLEMTGDVFETEDQRNWSDASFKTFCTPLDLEFPVQVNKGDKIYQRVSFYPLHPLPGSGQQHENGAITISSGDGKQHKLPAIGLAAPSGVNALSQQAIEAVVGVKPRFYCVEVNFETGSWEDGVAAQLEVAKSLKTGLLLQIEAVEGFEEKVGKLAELIGDPGDMPLSLLFTEPDQLVTGQAVIEWAEEHVRKMFPAALLGMGAVSNFAELNRNKRRINNTDFITYAINPQEHAFDHLTLIENMESQGDTVLSAQQLYPGASIHLNRVTLRKRINPYAKNKAERYPTAGQKADPRQPSLWAAGWTLGSIKYLAAAAASAITYYETAGNQGVCNESGQMYPVGILLKMILECGESSVLPTISSEPLQCTSLLLNSNGKNYLFLANHLNQSLRVNLPFRCAEIERVEPFPSFASRSEQDESDHIYLSPFDVVKLTAL